MSPTSPGVFYRIIRENKYNVSLFRRLRNFDFSLSNLIEFPLQSFLHWAPSLYEERPGVYLRLQVVRSNGFPRILGLRHVAYHWGLNGEESIVLHSPSIMICRCSYFRKFSKSVLRITWYEAYFGVHGVSLL